MAWLDIWLTEKSQRVVNEQRSAQSLRIIHPLCST
jgi:hypothetical protein